MARTIGINWVRKSINGTVGLLHAVVIVHSCIIIILSEFIKMIALN